MSPALADEVATLLNGVQERAFSGVFVSLILLVGAIGIFSQLEAAFDRLWHAVTPHERGAWGAVRNALWNRLKAFLTLMGLGVVVIVAFVTQLLFTGVQDWAEEEQLSWTMFLWPRLQIALSLTLNAGAMVVVFKMIPRTTVRWREAAIGALSVAVAWQIGAQIVSRYVVGGHYTAYGVVGSFIAMMLWVYCASILLFLGRAVGAGARTSGGERRGPGVCGRAGNGTGRRVAGAGHSVRRGRGERFARGRRESRVPLVEHRTIAVPAAWNPAVH